MDERDGRDKGADDRAATATTEDERELLRLWRSANEEGRRYIMAAAKSQEGWIRGYKLV